MASTNNVTNLENFLVAPSPGAVSKLFVPLTCCDMWWIGFSPVHSLHFYQHPISRTCFLDTVIPGLKNSLSIALKHFPLIAGNLIIPSDSTKPLIKYADGDSVPFLVVESDFHDFEYLTGNQPRICSEFYPLIPQLTKSTESGGSKMYPLVALQVTLFPGEGFCIGMTVNHVLGDGKSIYSFLKMWTTVSKFGEDEATKSNEFPPIYDREVMKVHTKELDCSFWSNSKETKLKTDMGITGKFKFCPEDDDKVRTTLVISLEDIQKLKKHVSDRHPSIKHLSTFAVLCAYVWTCLIKSRNVTIDEVEDEEEFIFAADCRGRTDPLIPINYFGNCTVGCLVRAKSVELCSEGGFFIATELIGDIIQKLLEFNGVHNALEKRFRKKAEFKDLNKLFSVAGSPRQNHYDMDFGWGKPKKFEITSTDSTGAMSLTGCRGNSGGVEIGLALQKGRMDVFNEIFSKGLQSL
ncbi:hypothetical protein LIER_25162 [Lithospermum erythrorhizon]|uniref:Uncharacterized protein n=1 Tax=Lithospermum erythrorhizon TaxID=34254 RepID=A0AAV3R9K7_LITER